MLTKPDFSAQAWGCAQVSRSLAACEGCLLVVDAAQGVEAQTLANVYLALENELEIIVVLNKVDLPGALVDAWHLGMPTCTWPWRTSFKSS